MGRYCRTSSRAVVDLFFGNWLGKEKKNALWCSGRSVQVSLSQPYLSFIPPLSQLYRSFIAALAQLIAALSQLYRSFISSFISRAPPPSGACGGVHACVRAWRRGAMRNALRVAIARARACVRACMRAWRNAARVARRKGRPKQRVGTLNTAACVRVREVCVCADPSRSEMRRRRQQEPISAGNRTRTAVQPSGRASTTTC